MKWTTKKLESIDDLKLSETFQFLFKNKHLTGNLHLLSNKNMLLLDELKSNFTYVYSMIFLDPKFPHQFFNN